MVVDWNDFDAVLFDLDGVLTPTADVHMRAWSRMFSDFLDREHPEQPPYTDADYFAHVDGRPRYDGVEAFLRSRGIEASDELVHALGDEKNDVFARVLVDEGVEAYPGSVRLVDWLRQHDKQIAVVSSSKNATKVLTAAGLVTRVDVVVDGLVAADEGIAGKPAPDTYLDAAKKLNVERSRAMVVEDAVSGVQAGHAGRFGLVVGVDRGAGADMLRQNGADLVVDDLAQLLPSGGEA